MRVMVTGSRTWTDEPKIREALALVNAAHVVLMHGAAPGADRIAAKVGREFGWDVQPYPADWSGPCPPECPPGHRKARGRFCPDAGKRRNAEMVAMRPEVVFAFPTVGSRGTWHTVTLAKAAGIEVIVVTPWSGAGYTPEACA